MKELTCFQKHFSQRVTHLPGPGLIPRTGWLVWWGLGGLQQLSGFPIMAPLTSEVREVGGDMNRWS